MIDPNIELYRWGPISGCPLFMYFTIKNTFKQMEKLLGVGYSDSVIIFQDNKVTWLLNKEQFVRHSKRFVQNHINDKDKRTKYLLEWYHLNQMLDRRFKRLSELSLASITFKRLLHEYEHFMADYYQWWSFKMSLELVTVFSEPNLGRRLNKYNKDDQQVHDETFAILTSPKKLTFYRRELKDMLHIIKVDPVNIDAAIKHHQRQYHWIYNSYLKAKTTSVKYFKKQYQELIKENWQKILIEVEGYPTNIQKQKETIFDAINISTKDRDLVSIVELFVYLQDERKEYNFKADHYLEKFISAFAKHYQTDKNNLRFLLPEEITQKEVALNESLIVKRHNIWVMTSESESIKHYLGDEAEMIANSYTKSSQKPITIIHGLLASSGNKHYFRGPARIVLTIDEVDKVNEGDILVTTMTSPDFIIGMKKAGAIVTDVGGMLCHAAIISRELGKPCIVNTNIATKTINDGDIIELHCGRGTVKIIRQTK